MSAPMMSRREVAAALKVSPKTLRRMARDGIGPQPIVLGPRLARYAPSAVAEFAGLAQAGGASHV